MAASTTLKNESLQKLLKMSLVPVPCQECELKEKHCTKSEDIEWILDLKDRLPIWSRLNDINCSGYKRKLPMSMTKNYDIEIKGRLWSLWGDELKYKKSQIQCKAHIAISVMALCAARVINLNIWNTSLINSIRVNGQKFFKDCLKQSKCCQEDFQLENLCSECNLEGIKFKICCRKVQKGYLFNVPHKCRPNLAYSLIQFFSSHQFGILECHNRILAFGYIDGPRGGYFMYDAQSSSHPLFLENISATYMLRTNHLHILLYCLIVSLNVTEMQVRFYLHQVQITIMQTNEKIIENNSGKSNSIPTCTPSVRFLKVFSDFSVNSSLGKISLNEELSNINQIQACTSPVQSEMTNKRKYRRKFYNITKEEEENSLIKPLVDADRKSDEEFRIKKDFVRMICSDTKLPLTSAELPVKSKKEFSCDLLDALVMGPRTCLAFNQL